MKQFWASVDYSNTCAYIYSAKMPLDFKYKILPKTLEKESRLETSPPTVFKSLQVSYEHWSVSSTGLHQPIGATIKQVNEIQEAFSSEWSTV